MTVHCPDLRVWFITKHFQCLSEKSACCLSWPHIFTLPNSRIFTFPLMLTLRVYGLLIHNGRILVSDELIKGQRITKFPGGGLEFGEGLKDCLIREIREEIGVEAFDPVLFYTTDFFQQSAFHSTPMQVVSVYLQVSMNRLQLM